MLQESGAQPEVTILHLGGVLVPAEELRDVLLCISLEGEPGPCPKAALLFLEYSSLICAFPPFPDEQLFESALWNSGKVKEAERSLFPTNKKQGTQRGLVPSRAPPGPAPLQKGCWLQGRLPAGRGSCLSWVITSDFRCQ